MPPSDHLEQRTVLLNACVPRRLKRELPELSIRTAQELDLDQIPDGELLNVLDGRIDVLVTHDRNLVFQQRIAGRRLAIVVIRSIDQSPRAFSALVPKLRIAIANAEPGEVVVVEPDRR